MVSQSINKGNKMTTYIRKGGIVYRVESGIKTAITNKLTITRANKMVERKNKAAELKNKVAGTC